MVEVKVNTTLRIVDEFDDHLADLCFLKLSNEYYVKTIPAKGLSEHELREVLKVLERKNEYLKQKNKGL